MRGLVLIAALGLAVASSAAAVPGASPEAVVDAFHAALSTGDTANAAALLADDALIFEEGHAERSKAEYAAHHLPADAAFSRAVPSKVTRRTGGSDGKLAWFASEGRTSGICEGKALDRVTTETMVLRRDEGGWTIVHIHWSSRAAAD
jgi:ketosteroid isomerase-like protein